MACAREIIGESENSLMATLISYDLQAGSYISAVKKNPEIKERWCQQVANIINRLSKDKKNRFWKLVVVRLPPCVVYLKNFPIFQSILLVLI